MSVCQSILAHLPEIQIVYFADDAFFPYGLLDELVLRKRLREVVAAMLLQHKPDLVVLACNTVSTLVLPDLRAEFDVPFVGVVPAIKPAAQLSQTGAIGLLATPATVKRAYTDQLIEDYASQCKVLRIGTNELVEQAEALLSGHSVDEAVISDVLEPFRHELNGLKVDVVVLGCTHFPLLAAHLSAILPGICFVDSGAAIAKRVEHLLGLTRVEYSGEQATSHTCVHQIYFSNMTPNEAVFSESLRYLGLLRYQLYCFSASMD